MPRILLAGLSHEMFELATEQGHVVVALSDPAGPETTWRDLPCHQSDADALAAGGFDAVLLAIDQPEARRKAYRFYIGAGVECISLLAGRVSETARYGAGLLVQHGAHLSAQCRVGDGVRLNYGANVMHETTLGDFTTVAPNAVVLGHVTIGALSYIGANATILPNRRVGAGCIVGAGAIVTTDVAEGVVVKGNPAE